MKAKSVEVWKSIDRLKRYKLALNENQDMKNLVAGKPVSTPYARRLTDLQKIMGVISLIAEDDAQRQKDILRMSALKTTLPIFLKNLKLLE